MIDLHCHLLPGVDDGPSTLAESLELARIAVANGITHAVVTPHIHPERYENSLQSIHSATNQFRAALQQHNIPLEVGMAAEVRVCQELLQLIEKGKVPFLGEHNGYRVLLLEMPHSHVPPGTDKLVQWLLSRQIKPMIAHPERNKDVIRDFGTIIPFVEAGCLLQVTSGAFSGQFGSKAQKRAEQLLEKGWITILASDAHNAKHRPPELASGVEAAAQLVGLTSAKQLVEDVPRRLTEKLFASEQRYLEYQNAPAVPEVDMSGFENQFVERRRSVRRSGSRTLETGITEPEYGSMQTNEALLESCRKITREIVDQSLRDFSGQLNQQFQAVIRSELGRMQKQVDEFSLSPQILDGMRDGARTVAARVANEVIQNQLQNLTADLMRQVDERLRAAQERQEVAEKFVIQDMQSQTQKIAQEVVNEFFNITQSNLGRMQLWMVLSVLVSVGTALAVFFLK
ncbi:MAG TPA: CpsB/CapC family capsule biosynthesis tyrosine phosphatase [Pseudomonadales bacterium]|nr:CpsB/CapC family capsule biosynthesis tyrosine phosphatase [Pseudomonadales bacterium]